MIYQQLLKTDPIQQEASEYVRLLISPEGHKVLEQNDFAWLKGAFLTRGIKKCFLNSNDTE
jgi:hypothetical protein